MTAERQGVRTWELEIRGCDGDGRDADVRMQGKVKREPDKQLDEQ